MRTTAVGREERLRCPTLDDHILLVVDAVYGQVLTEGGCLDYSAVFQVVSRCHGQPRCNFGVRHSDFEGVCPEDDAYVNLLNVTFFCPEGKQTHVIVRFINYFLSKKKIYFCCCSS